MVSGLFVCLSVSCLAVEWHHPLSRDGGGVWRQRIPIKVSNPTDRAFEGVPVRTRAGSGGIALQGTAEAVRVCDSRGQELLFALTDSQGLSVAHGPVPSSGYLTIPVECPSHQTATSYVYFDNPSAGELPDFLTDHSTLINGDVESGAGSSPAGWEAGHVRRDSSGHLDRRAAAIGQALPEDGRYPRRRTHLDSDTPGRPANRRRWRAM